jgi:hypothetical protein
MMGIARRAAAHAFRETPLKMVGRSAAEDRMRPQQRGNCAMPTRRSWLWLAGTGREAHHQSTARMRLQ